MGIPEMGIYAFCPWCDEAHELDEADLREDEVFVECSECGHEFKIVIVKWDPVIETYKVEP